MEGLRKLEKVSEVRKEGDKFRIFTDDPPSVIAQLADFANSRGDRIISLNTYGPSLEDVFIRLTGLDVHVKGVRTVD